MDGAKLRSVPTRGRYGLADRGPGDQPVEHTETPTRSEDKLAAMMQVANHLSSFFYENLERLLPNNL